MKKSNVILFFLNFALWILFSCSNLKSHEIAQVNHTYEACFYHEKNTVLIYRDSSKVIAELLTNDTLEKRVILSDKQLDSFYLFINELKSLNEASGCTTVEYYIAYTRTGKIEKEDGGCDWEGFNKLCKVLFSITKF